VLAAHDVSDGGMLTAIAEMSLASRYESWPRTAIGAHLDTLDIAIVGWFGNESWFEEFPGFVCEVADEAAFTELARETGIRVHVLGKTIAEPALVYHRGNDAVGLQHVRDAWESPMRDFYGSVA
jgi:selenophosphate synthetase-related protein